MQPQELEPEMEALLRRIAPGFDALVVGAHESDIERIREIVGHELPRFYEWFLRRMGGNMGPFTYPRRDFTARRVIWCYEQGVAEPDPDDLLIGYDTSPDSMDLQIFYDFTHPCRDDARIGKGERDAGPWYPRFETFREFLGWGQITSLVMPKAHTRCEGVIRTVTQQNPVDQLRSFMAERGFEEPLPTGPHCAIFMRTDPGLVMTCYRSMLVETNVTAFDLAGYSQAWVRRLLGELATSGAFELCETESI